LKDTIIIFIYIEGPAKGDSLKVKRGEGDEKNL